MTKPVGSNTVMRATMMAVALVATAAAQAQAPSDWTEPFPPFKIAGNLY